MFILYDTNLHLIGIESQLLFIYRSCRTWLLAGNSDCMKGCQNLEVRTSMDHMEHAQNPTEARSTSFVVDSGGSEILQCCIPRKHVFLQCKGTPMSGTNRIM